jgi:AraC-like DNA-binding protein
VWARAYAAAFDAEHVWPPAIRASTLLRASPEKPLDLDTVAAAVGCSRSVLVRSFRREFGQSAGAVLADIRVDKAVDALRNTDWSIQAIARLVGYRNEGNLYTAVKRRCGMTPVALRRLGDAPLPLRRHEL